MTVWELYEILELVPCQECVEVYVESDHGQSGNQIGNVYFTTDETKGVYSAEDLEWKMYDYIDNIQDIKGVLIV